MFMIRVSATVRADGREAFVAQLDKEAIEVPARFAGCERYAVYVDRADPACVFLYEEWRDRDAFDAYRTSEYFRESGDVLFPLMAGTPDSAYYESQRVGP
jgi:quinol monooxygenase YgiN